MQRLSDFALCRVSRTAPVLYESRPIFFGGHSNIIFYQLRGLFEDPLSRDHTQHRIARTLFPSPTISGHLVAEFLAIQKQELQNLYAAAGRNSRIIQLAGVVRDKCNIRD
jgi:hypothetical protein